MTRQARVSRDLGPGPGFQGPQGFKLDNSRIWAQGRMYFLESQEDCIVHPTRPFRAGAPVVFCLLFDFDKPWCFIACFLPVVSCDRWGVATCPGSALARWWPTFEAFYAKGELGGHGRPRAKAPVAVPPSMLAQVLQITGSARRPYERMHLACRALVAYRFCCGCLSIARSRGTSGLSYVLKVGSNLLRRIWHRGRVHGIVRVLPWRWSALVLTKPCHVVGRP